MLMQQDFVPYLGQVVPAIFQLASLNPEMAIAGQSERDLLEVLSEIKAEPVAGSGSKKLQITTYEIEEKSAGIRTLAVFIDEMKGHFAPYIEPSNKIVNSLVDYEANNVIRNTVAQCMAGLVTCAKEGFPQQPEFTVQLANQYLEQLWKAIKKEDETETLICQT